MLKRRDLQQRGCGVCYITRRALLVGCTHCNQGAQMVIAHRIHLYKNQFKARELVRKVRIN